MAKDIIAEGDVNAVNQRKDPTQQNQYLHAHLVKTCDDEALRDVCDIIIAVRGNRKMKKLGEDMKGELNSKCHARSYLYLHPFMTVDWCVHDPTLHPLIVTFHNFSDYLCVGYVNLRPSMTFGIAAVTLKLLLIVRLPMHVAVQKELKAPITPCHIVVLLTFNPYFLR